MRYPEIAAGIKKARLRKGWSQEFAAREIGTNRRNWIHWEQGRHRPSAKFSTRLVTILGVSAELLVDDDEEDELAMVSDLTRGIRALVNREIAKAIGTERISA